MGSRQRLTRMLLALTVLAGGPLAGAKLLDLLVLAGAWSTNPSVSLAIMQDGKARPVASLAFFIPLFAATAMAGFGSLIAGWRTPWRFRWLLCVSSIGILLLIVLTFLAFWPFNAAWYYHGASMSVLLDWVGVAGAVAAFAAPLYALIQPWPQEQANDPPLFRAVVRIALLAIAAFLAWLVASL